MNTIILSFIILVKVLIFSKKFLFHVQHFLLNEESLSYKWLIVIDSSLRSTRSEWHEKLNVSSQKVRTTTVIARRFLPKSKMPLGTIPLKLCTVLGDCTYKALSASPTSLQSQWHRLPLFIEWIQLNLNMYIYRVQARQLYLKFHARKHE